MGRLCVLLCALLFFQGCASEGNAGKWDEFWRDLRGDNMKIRNESQQSGGEGGDGRPPFRSNRG
ncbi:MAG: hypothetical protein HY040_06195 [Planctomycetes bacterium]|nr:hypothetical protein [Planctomycetota bacterium]